MSGPGSFGSFGDDASVAFVDLDPPGAVEAFEVCSLSIVPFDRDMPGPDVAAASSCIWRAVGSAMESSIGAECASPNFTRRPSIPPQLKNRGPSKSHNVDLIRSRMHSRFPSSDLDHYFWSVNSE